MEVRSFIFVERPFNGIRRARGGERERGVGTLRVFTLKEDRKEPLRREREIIIKAGPKSAKSEATS